LVPEVPWQATVRAIFRFKKLQNGLLCQTFDNN
jgi:hypothetical protein